MVRGCGESSIIALLLGALAFGAFPSRKRAEAIPPLTDPELLLCYKNALANWRYHGYVQFTEVAQEWIRVYLSNLTPREIGRLMYEHIANGGEIDQQKETRPEWNVHDFHFDIRLSREGRLVYIETRLIYDDPEDPDYPVIHVVNVHYA